MCTAHQRRCADQQNVSLSITPFRDLCCLALASLCATTGHAWSAATFRTSFYTTSCATGPAVHPSSTEACPSKLTAHTKALVVHLKVWLPNLFCLLTALFTATEHWQAITLALWRCATCCSSSWAAARPLQTRRCRSCRWEPAMTQHISSFRCALNNMLGHASPVLAASLIPAKESPHSLALLFLMLAAFRYQPDQPTSSHRGALLARQALSSAHRAWRLRCNYLNLKPPSAPRCPGTGPGACALLRARLPGGHAAQGRNPGRGAQPARPAGRRRCGVPGGWCVRHWLQAQWRGGLEIRVYIAYAC